MSERLYLDTCRTGYAPNQCRGTLTVGELIELLSEYDGDTEVYFRNDGGYTYGEITDAAINLCFEEE